MFTPLITKLQNCNEKSDLESIYEDIIVVFNNKNFPTDDFKEKAKTLITFPIEKFIEEFEFYELRERNNRIVESIKLFDTF